MILLSERSLLRNTKGALHCFHWISGLNVIIERKNVSTARGNFNASSFVKWNLRPQTCGHEMQNCSHRFVTLLQRKSCCNCWSKMKNHQIIQISGNFKLQECFSTLVVRQRTSALLCIQCCNFVKLMVRLQFWDWFAVINYSHSLSLVRSSYGGVKSGKNFLD